MSELKSNIRLLMSAMLYISVGTCTILGMLVLASLLVSFDQPHIVTDTLIITGAKFSLVLACLVYFGKNAMRIIFSHFPTKE